MLTRSFRLDGCEPRPPAVIEEEARVLDLKGKG
jgi:hypothetical protein